MTSHVTVEDMPKALEREFPGISWFIEQDYARWSIRLRAKCKYTGSIYSYDIPYDRIEKEGIDAGLLVHIANSAIRELSEVIYRQKPKYPTYNSVGFGGRDATYMVIDEFEDHYAPIPPITSVNSDYLPRIINVKDKKEDPKIEGLEDLGVF